MLLPRLLFIITAIGSLWSAEIAQLPDAVPAAVADRQAAQIPDRVHLDGMLGARIRANAAGRMQAVDVDRLLEGYRRRPGRQTWDGEHIGKWLHAATLTWANTGDAALRAKLDATVVELMKCQQEDGYLGTYLPKDRWSEWDVWAHKYNLIGLITYMRYTGERGPLDCCRRMADLLCRDFGDGRRDLNTAGQHVGMASGSVLEPMVLLYRLTGDVRYRDFCSYILRSWERPNGAHIVSRLLQSGRVDQVGNGKAYEMLSCINGLLEWHRTTGDPEALRAAVAAWEDIAARRLYITGTASYYEHFHGDFDLPNIGNVGETCVTVTWLQLNLHLLRLTAQARYADEIERTVYNQLPGAQSPDGTAWGYYVQMEGTKPWSSSLDGHCCLSSGPRGMALIPTAAMTTDADGVVVNLHDAGEARLRLADGLGVTVRIDTAYPAEARIGIAIQPEKAAEFAVKVRIPPWCSGATLRLGEQLIPPAAGGGYATVRRTWRPGDRLDLVLPPTPRAVAGDHLNQGKLAICYGPLVLAADAALDPAGRQNPCLTATQPAIVPLAATGFYRDWPHAQVFRLDAIGGSTVLTSFATAGAGLAKAPADEKSQAWHARVGSRGARYRVWLRTAGDHDIDGDLLPEGRESRSRQGNRPGLFLAGETVVTHDGARADRDWYAVELDAPVAIRRVLFFHGHRFHDGGWFDAAAGKPQVQIQETAGGPWSTVGELADYPATTAVDGAGLSDGARFACVLPKPVQAVAVRVIGVPASGDAPRQAFSSCCGLKALAQ